MGSQFLRTTTRIQSGPDVVDESKLEGKTSKEIPTSSRLEFLERFLTNNFDLSDADDNMSGQLNRGSIADLPLLRTLLEISQKSWDPNFWKVMDSFVLLA